jgi:hypothetical protein
MFKHIVFRILMALVLIAAIAGIAGFAFNAGVARGAAMNIQIPATGGQPVPFYGYGMPYPHMAPFFGFGLIGLLAPLFLLFLVFGAARRMMWGHRFGGQHMPHGPWGDKGPGGESVPAMFAEWHRKAHAGSDDQPQAPAEK